MLNKALQLTPNFTPMNNDSDDFNDDGNEGLTVL